MHALLGQVARAFLHILRQVLVRQMLFRQEQGKEELKIRLKRVPTRKEQVSGNGEGRSKFLRLTGHSETVWQQHTAEWKEM